MAARQDNGATRLDDAARAGWLYYVAGNTQEEVATKMGISRQSAQRLVSLSVSEGLIKVRLDHPIGRCMDLGARLKSRFALDLVEIVPSDPTSESTTIGVAEAGAAEIERWLVRPEPITMAIGTGRTLKAAIELCTQAGFHVENVAVLVNLKFLNQMKFKNTEVFSLVQY